MCVYSYKIRNPKYKPNKKNNNVPPECEYKELEYIEIDCGECIDCRKKKLKEWQMRILEEMKDDTERIPKFVTFTFNEDWLSRLEKEAEEKYGVADTTNVSILAVRYFRERWRWYFKKSIKHWFINELGSKNTERLHIHGIIWVRKEDLTDWKTIKWGKKSPEIQTSETLAKIWKYGNITAGYYCNEKTVSYIMKYLTKEDEAHPGFKGRILVSPGIGKGYIEKDCWKEYHKFNYENTKTKYKKDNGYEFTLCTYYKRKLFTDEQREWLRLYTSTLPHEYVAGNLCLKIWNRTKTEYIVENKKEIIDYRRQRLRELNMKWNKRERYECRFGERILMNRCEAFKPWE